MSNLKLAIVLGFSLMFVAGLAVGRSPSTPAPTPRQGSWLSDELHLTPEQQDRMKVIWKIPVRPELPRQLHDEDHQLNVALLNLLTPEQKDQYEQLKKDHDTHVGALQAEHEQAMRDAEDRTRQMLTEEQRKKYDEILKAHGHRRGPPRNVHRHTRPADTGPGTHAD